MAHSTKSRRPRRRFTEEFRAGAVRLVLDDGKTAGQVARELDLTDIYELPATPGGVRSMADVDMAVPLGSRAHKVLHAVYESDSREPMRLRTEQHVGMWSILSYRWPGVPSDGCVRLTLQFCGPA